MKEATGELNVTVITVVAIAAVMALFLGFVMPTIKDKVKTNVNNGTTVTEESCKNAGGTWDAGANKCNF